MLIYSDIYFQLCRNPISKSLNWFFALFPEALSYQSSVKFNYVENIYCAIKPSTLAYETTRMKQFRQVPVSSAISTQKGLLIKIFHQSSSAFECIIVVHSVIRKWKIHAHEAYFKIFFSMMWNSKKISWFFFFEDFTAKKNVSQKMSKKFGSIALFWNITNSSFPFPYIHMIGDTRWWQNLLLSVKCLFRRCRMRKKNRFCFIPLVRVIHSIISHSDCHRMRIRQSNKRELRRV